jgi:hypothetical protein
MEMTVRALVTMLHGMLFGAFFIMTAFGLVIELFRSGHVKQPAELTPRGYSLERFYLITMVVLGWAAVFSGAYIIYPWYRAVPPAGMTDLVLYPKYALLASSKTAGWHSVGMEWKEHIAYIAVIAMTMVGYVFAKYRRSMQEHPQVRFAVLVFALVAFGSAGAAGLFGAMINKYAPLNGGSTIHLTGKRQ